MLRVLKPWLPVLLWMAIIFVASTDLGSAAHTSRIIEPLLRWVKPDITRDSLEFVHTLVRKGAHLTEYAILALLALRAANKTLRPTPGSWFRAAGLALLVAVTYAATDEFHQSFVSSRGASVRDVMIDSCGALLGLTAGGLWRWRRKPPSATS